MQDRRVEDFAALIAVIHEGMRKAKADCARTLGLKPVHTFWIYLLKARPEGLSATQLAAASKTSASLVSREIEALVKQGLLQGPTQSGKRRYGFKFRLTPAGQAAAEALFAFGDDVQRAVNAGIAPEDLVIFYRTLRALADAFERKPWRKPVEGGSSSGHTYHQ